MEYRREIDGLRALAVLPVILFHAGIPGFSGGFVGVDVFFVISGYLITSIILADLAAGQFTLAGFYERRARRILPALFLVMALSLPLAWFWLAPSDLQDFGKSLISVALYGSNFYFWQQSGYFDTAAELKPMLHTWSLAVEEQYYLLFPALLLFAWRRCRPHLASLLGALAILSLIWAESRNVRYPASTFFLLPSRGWELIAGALAAIHGPALRDRFAPGAWMEQVASFSGLLLILFAVMGFSQETPFPGLYALVPVAGAVAILLFATHHTVIGRWLGSRPLVAIGLLSYSAYLWHQPVFAFARHASPQTLGKPVLAGLALLSFGMAFLSWRFVERPFRTRSFASRRQVFTFAAVGSLFFILVGVGAQAANELSRFRVSPRQQAWFDTAQRSPMRESCHNMGKNQLSPQHACEYFGQHIEWAVLGDSHAVELAYALAIELKPRDAGVKHFSSSSCPPSLEASSADAECAAWTRATLEQIQTRPDIKFVVLSYRINKYLWGEHEKTYPQLPAKGTDEGRAALWKDYLELIAGLQRMGKQVVVVLQAPELSRRMTDLAFQVGTGSAELVGVPAHWWKLRNAYVHDRLRQIPASVKIIDPANLFCDETSCYATRNGASLYFDDDHMSVVGASFIARHLLEVIDSMN